MKNSRQFYRAPASHSVEVLTAEGRHTGCLENISFNGALLRLDAAVSFAAGESCVLQFQVDEEPLPPLQIACEVVHGCDELLGVKFMESKEDAERRLLFLMKLTSDTRQNGDEYLERIRAYLAEYCGPR